MRAIALDDARLLDCSDRATELDRPWRELALLESASGVSSDELARLSIGERDRLLLRIRIATFGERIECETSCPRCGARLELALDATQLLMPHRTVALSDLEVTDEEWTVRFRLPDSTDIAAIGADAMSNADAILAERCIAVVSSANGSVELPARVRERVVERMATLDPQADVLLDLSCIVCEAEWQTPFDPAELFLREVDGYASRLTAEVHRLAIAYGWSESSILAMGAARRQRYMSLLLQ